MRGFVLSHTHLVGVGVAGVDEGVCIESYTPGRRWCSRGGRGRGR